MVVLQGPMIVLNFCLINKTKESICMKERFSLSIISCVCGDGEINQLEKRVAVETRCGKALVLQLKCNARITIKSVIQINRGFKIALFLINK